MDSEELTELREGLRKISEFPPGAHWLCPRKAADDVDTYEDVKTDEIKDEDAESSEETKIENQRKRLRLEAVQAGRIRSSVVTRELMLFAFVDNENQEMKWFQQGLNSQLSSCDVCVLNYYQKKLDLQKSLLDENYDEDTIQPFFEAIDEWDVKRIQGRLVEAHQQLNSVTPKERNFRSVDPASLLAIYEVLANPKLLRFGELQAVFSDVFRLVQTNNYLKVLYYVPALIQFLFDPDDKRSTWAQKSLAKIKKSPTEIEFDWAIREPLLVGMQWAQSGLSPKDPFLFRFWCGVTLLVGVLDKERITHSLRGMDVDIYRLCLEHLSFDSPILRFILQTIATLLEKSPADFWDAMGVITPTILIEQIFSSPWFNRFLKEAKSDDSAQTSALQDMISWTKPFIDSLGVQSKTVACKAFTTECFKRSSDLAYPPHIRLRLLELGFKMLDQTMTSLVNNAFKDAASSYRFLVNDAMQVLEERIDLILELSTQTSVMQILKLKEPNDELQLQYEDLGGTNIGMRILKVALALDCRCVKADSQMILLAVESRQTIDYQSFKYSRRLWEQVANRFQSNNWPFARNVFGAMLFLIGVEKFRVNREESLSQAKKAFNLNYGVLTTTIGHILSQIAEYDAEYLQLIFEKPDTANSALAILFSPDAAVHDAGLSIIKQLSGEISRQDAIAHLLRAKDLGPTSLYSFAWALRRVAREGSFSWNPSLLKTNIDVIDVLCNTQDGLLRAEHFPLHGPEGVNVVSSYWEHIWLVIETIFKSTESWGKQNDLDVMREFARDSIEFAERLFDQHLVFQQAVEQMEHKAIDLTGDVSDEVARKILDPPKQALGSMVKWLRLRDDYLANILVSLVCKLLRRLGQHGVEIDEQTYKFIEDIAVKSTTRSILTDQQKAEVVRSLKQNRKDFEISVKTESPVKTAPRKLAGSKSKTDFLDFDKWIARAAKQKDESEGLSDESIVKTPGLEKFKSHALSQVKPKPVVPRRTVEQDQAAKQSEFLQQRKKYLAEQKKQKEEAAALRKPKLPAVPKIGGAALSGIGIKGKEHPVEGGSEMMVSDSSDESTDEEDTTLFKRITKGDKLRDEKRNANLQALKRGPVQKIKQIRSHKDTRARLAPDLTRLHRTILDWDIFHDGVLPPKSELQDYRMVVSKFGDAKSYRETFEPLLALECWQSFQKAKEEDLSKPFKITIANRMTVDTFVEVNSSISSADYKEYNISESDIILVSRGATPMTQPAEPHCLARIHSITRKKAMVEITYRINQGTQLGQLLLPKAELYGVKISSMTPVEREYGALVGLQYYDLMEEVLEARISPILDYTHEKLKPLQDIYKVNSAQARAIASALDNDCFTLIQGPPGSGKTKTIVAIVGAILTPAFNMPSNLIRATQPNGASAQKPVKKLLICAPSNAAVDELVMRFKLGIVTKEGQQRKPTVVRIGRSDAINQSVIDVTLEELVKKRLNETKTAEPDAGEQIHSLVDDMRSKADRMTVLKAEFERLRDEGKPAPPEMQREMDVLRRDRALVGGKLDKLRDKQNMKSRDAEIARRRVQQEILDQAHIICATLSGSGHEMMRNLNIEFETVVIDEAAQSIELSALIPLKYGCNKCILVGDPKQLPPTVLSREASKFQYEQSLFVRMQTNQPNDVHLLDTQYRMHPHISAYPSKAFYDGKLLDGSDMERLRRQPWHAHPLLSPYRFFDVKGRHQTAATGHSLVNHEELEAAMMLYERLTLDYRGIDFKGKIGIITPYKSQLFQLKVRFEGKYGKAILDNIEFNTTDAYQGRESEIIIFSCVRAAPSGGIGFLSDIRRMNVGLTRAKSSLWVLGNTESLVRGPYWKDLVEDAQARSLYTSGDLRALLTRGAGNAQPASPPGFKPPQLSLPSSVKETPTPAPKARAGGSIYSYPKARAKDADGDIDMADAAPAPTPIRKDEARRPSVPDSRDIAMRDAPHGPRATNKAQLERKNSTSNMPTTQPDRQKTIPRSEHRVLATHSIEHEQPLCNNCQRTDHTARTCDRTSIHACYRCGSDGHFLIKCDVPICEKCGTIGRSTDACTNTSRLPQWQADILRKDLKAFEKKRKAMLEENRQEQLKNHNSQVPRISNKKNEKSSPERLTTKIDSKKRKRQSNPPGQGSQSPPLKYHEQKGLSNPRMPPSGPKGSNGSRHSREPLRRESGSIGYNDPRRGSNNFRPGSNGPRYPPQDPRSVRILGGDRLSASQTPILDYDEPNAASKPTEDSVGAQLSRALDAQMAQKGYSDGNRPAIPPRPIVPPPRGPAIKRRDPASSMFIQPKRRNNPPQQQNRPPPPNGGSGGQPPPPPPPTR